MFLNLLELIFLIIILSIISIPTNILAYSDYVLASGETIGIEIKNKGVIISDFYKEASYIIWGVCKDSRLEEFYDSNIEDFTESNINKAMNKDNTCTVKATQTEVDIGN